MNGMKRERWLALLLAALLAASMAACAPAEKDGEEGAETSVSEDESSGDREEAGEKEEEDESRSDREDEEAPEEENTSSRGESGKKPAASQQASPSKEQSPSKAEEKSSSSSSSAASSATDRTKVKTKFERTYENKDLGLKIEFPKEWANSYTPAVTKNTELVPKVKGTLIEFFYKDDRKNAMALINVFDAGDYDEIEDTLIGYGLEIGRNDRYVFLGDTPSGCPFADGSPDAELFNKLHFSAADFKKLVTIGGLKGAQPSSGASAAESSLSKSEQEKYFGRYADPLRGIITQSWDGPAAINPTSLMIFALSQAKAAGENPEGTNGDFIPREELEKYIAAAFDTDGSELRAYSGYSKEEAGYRNDMSFGGGTMGYVNLDAVESGSILTLTFGVCPWDDAKNDWGAPKYNATLKIHTDGDSFYYISNKVTNA